MVSQQRMKTWCYGVVVLLLCLSDACGDDSEEALSEVDLPSPSDISDVLENAPVIENWKERCRDMAGEEAVKDIEDSKEILVECVTKIIKWDKLLHEINRSIPRGDLDLVFKKYCGKRDSIMVCVDERYSKFKLCLNEREQQDLDILRAAIDAGLDFVCENDGDKIALFMGEKGGECVRSQKDNISECIQEKVPDVKDIQDDFFDIPIGKIAINEENCKKVNAMHQCVVKWTEKCDDSTPANILDSLIVQMLKVTPCKQTSSATTLLVSAPDVLPRMLTLFAAALTAANILL